MPYTKDELKTHSFYQNLIDEDEQKYLNDKQLLMDRAAISGSTDDGNLLVRDEENNVLLFEDPYKNEIPKDPSTRLVVKTIVDRLKDDESINDIIDRDIREL